MLPTTERQVPRGFKLTPGRLAAMKIGNNFLSLAEKQFFVDMPFEYEGMIAFDESEMGLLHPSIEPPVIVHTIPHTPWQQQNLRLPKAMQDIATAHVNDKLVFGILELSQGPYRSRYFLMEKKNELLVYGENPVAKQKEIFVGRGTYRVDEGEFRSNDIRRLR
jgi:hypothetical protein